MSSTRSLGHWMILAVFVGMMATAQLAHAKKAVITMKDGRTIDAQVVEETAQTVTIDLNGIRTAIAVSDIEKIEYQKTLVDEYKARKAALKPGDKVGWFNLCRWLYDADTQQADLLAKRELDALLTAHPDYQNAKLVQTLVDRRLEQRGTETGTDTGTGGTTTSTGGTTTNTGTGNQEVEDWPMLTIKQIRLLKVYEVNLASKPKVVIPRPTIDAFLEKYRQDPILESYQGLAGQRKFKAMDGYEQLGLIFQAKARELYDQVLIRDEPVSLKTFRSQVNPTYIAGYCADCHGKADAPKFYLFKRGANSEPVAYSNFVILNEYKTAQGPLIDFVNPDDSLLLQYGLPENQAKFPHPTVQNRRPYFTGPKDKRMQLIKDWIVKDLNRVNPQVYPLQYTIPRQGPAVQTVPPARSKTPPAPAAGTAPPAPKS